MDLTRWLRFPLFHKYAAVLVFLVSGALLTSSLFELYFTDQESRAARVDLLQQEARAAASRIEQFVQDIRRQTEWTSQTLPAAGPEAPDERYFGYLGLLRLLPAITELRYLDNSGVELLRVSRLAMNDVESRVVYPDQRRLQQALAGPPYPRYLRDSYEPYMTMAVSEREAEAGNTVAEVNLTYVRDVVQQVKVGEAGFAFVVDRDGNLVAHRDLNLMYQQLNLRSCPQVGAALGLDQPIAGTLPRDACRPRVLSAHTAIDPLGWLVIVEQPEAEALAPLYASLLRTIVLLVVGLGVAALASLTLARMMVKPIRELQKAAAEIGTGNLERRIDLRTGDELEALADEFNHMTSQLRESYGQLRESRDLLDQRVEERTRQLTEALEQQTATSGILRLITRSPTDLQVVFDAVAERAASLCDADSSSVWLLEGERLRRVAGFGSMATEVPVERPLTGEWMSGRAVLQGQTIHVPDRSVLDADEFPESRRFGQYGHRSAVSTPIRRDGETIGVISLGRREVRPFSERQIKLLETFADQIVIAVENTRLFQAVEERSDELARSLEELQDKSIRLEVASRRRQRLLQSMSHQIKNPLQAIRLFVRSIRNGIYDGDPDTKRDRVQRAEASVEHLLRLVDDALKLARVDAGKLKIAIADYALQDILETVRRSLESRAEEKELRLEVAVPPALPTGIGDGDKITEALMNLVDNAIKFTDVGEVCVHAQAASEQFVISVRDTGPGIPEADREKIFEEFHQASSATMRKESGTGLGLAIARYYIEAHGGQIRVEACQGQGSSFRIELPIRANGQAKDS